MDNNLTTVTINSWIDDLVGTIGIKEHAPCEEYAKLLISDQTKECIAGIASHLGLPIKIDLTFVTSNWRASGYSGFKSKDLVKTDSRGRGNDGITAQVNVPSWLPPYGSPSLKDYPISVKVSDDCQIYPESFIAIMAHELSHIVLASLSHPEKDNEFYTDLTAMVLGFAEVTKRGRKVSLTSTDGNIQTTQTTTYGYLTDTQFDIAYDRIIGLLEERLRPKRNLLRQIDVIRMDLASAYKRLGEFNQFVACLDQNTNRRIKPEDGHQIVQLHRPGYASEHEKTLNITMNIVSEIERSLRDIRHHTKTTAATIEKRANELNCVQEGLTSLSMVLAQDVRVLRRNLPPVYRLRAFLLGLATHKYKSARGKKPKKQAIGDVW